MSAPPRRQAPPEPARTRTVHIVQGEYAISSDPDLMYTTILGSCVAACLRDPIAGVGGMNHFLLPGDKDDRGDAMRYGVHSMELLINGLLQRGAIKSRLEGKLFGGANVVHGLTDVGAQNARFAVQFLQKEGIALLGDSLGGDRARRIRYWPVSGRAAQQFLAPTERQVFEAERRKEEAAPSSGSLELF
ncbi:MAG: chemotaxis protein CheD [Hydrogenophilaceae bacterium]|jgi:chemotaxis protein CheD|nr:chemotaxis protein CheD [Hydrogenophilaceae bacterium]